MVVEGTYPMLYAFFDEEGELRRDAFAAQIGAARSAGASGVAVLGLATEVTKLSRDERRSVVEWAAEEIGGDMPLAVTVADQNYRDMIESARFARAAGAAWVILQPPPPASEAELIRFFGAVADRLDCPVAIQNAPQFLGIGLSNTGLIALNRAHPNISVVKAEDTAVGVARLIAAVEGRMTVFNGRNGLELVDNYRAGVAGMIPGIETIDRQAAVEKAMRAGDEARAETLYREALPAIAFVMQGIDHLLLYGKLIAACRLGIAPSGRRIPSEEPRAIGEAWARRYAAELGPLAKAPEAV